MKSPMTPPPTPRDGRAGERPVSDPYLHGLRCARAKLPESSNPFAPDTEPHLLWQNGFADWKNEKVKR